MIDKFSSFLKRKELLENSVMTTTSNIGGSDDAIAITPEIKNYVKNVFRKYKWKETLDCKPDEIFANLPCFLVSYEDFEKFRMRKKPHYHWSRANIQNEKILNFVKLNPKVPFIVKWNENMIIVNDFSWNKNNLKGGKNV